VWGLERLLSTPLYVRQSGLKNNLRNCLVKWEDQKRDAAWSLIAQWLKESLRMQETSLQIPIVPDFEH